MANWKTISLGEYFDFSSGLSKSADQFGSGYPFLSFKEVFRNYFVPESLVSLVNTTKKEREKCSVRKGDIFLTRTSETNDELGMSCVALKDYPNATFNGFTKRLRPKFKGIVDPIFIGFYLRSSQFRAQISAYSNLSTRASLNNDILERLKLNIPPIDEQLKIGRILMDYTSLIENNNQRIQLLEEMAAEIYKEWFVRFRFPSYESATFVDKEGKEVPHGTDGALPLGWERVKLGDIIEQVKRKPKIKKDEYRDEGLYPIIDQGEKLIAGYTDKEKYVQREPLPILIFGDHTRRVKFIDFPFVSGADGTQLLVPKNKSLLSTYFYLAVSRIDLSNFHYARHFKYLKQEYILIPTTNVVEHYNKITAPFLKEIDLLRAKNKTLQQTRDLLLPRLISGKLSVENLALSTIEAASTV